VNCSHYSAPITAPQSGPKPYRWGEIERQNGLIRQLIATEFPTVIYWDVATATALRPDLHAKPVGNKDCLHYQACLPSAVDNWVRGLQNVLQLAGQSCLAAEDGVRPV
jgi:hypothetical protein